MDSVLKDLDRWSQCTVEEELAPPIKEIALARIGVSGEFVFVGGRDELPILFLHLAQQVVEFSGVLKFQELLNLPTGVGETPRDKIAERQVVTIVVGGWIDALGTLQIGHGISDSLGLDIEFAEVVVGVKVLRLKLCGLL